MTFAMVCTLPSLYTYIIENYWRKLIRAVYKNGSQYDNILQLKESTKVKRDNLFQNTIQKLYKFLSWLVKVTENKIVYTRY